ncbi:MAG TPA: hypothetical protein VGA78_10100 [Gemmatimonadales bacterium]
MRVEEAVARGARGEVRLTGFLVGRIEGDVRLCAELLESYPPQCGGSSVVVRGLRRDAIPTLRMEQGGLWSEGEVEIAGTLERGVLEVSAGAG